MPAPVSVEAAPSLADRSDGPSRAVPTVVAVAASAAVAVVVARRFARR